MFRRRRRCARSQFSSDKSGEPELDQRRTTLTRHRIQAPLQGRSNILRPTDFLRIRSARARLSREIRSRIEPATGEIARSRGVAFRVCFEHTARAHAVATIVENKKQHRSGMKPRRPQRDLSIGEHPRAVPHRGNDGPIRSGQFRANGCRPGPADAGAAGAEAPKRIPAETRKTANERAHINRF